MLFRLLPFARVLVLPFQHNWSGLDDPALNTVYGMSREWLVWGNKDKDCSAKSNNYASKELAIDSASSIEHTVKSQYVDNVEAGKESTRVVVPAIPVVMVEGFLGSGTSRYWGPLVNMVTSSRPNRQLFYPKLGCVSSMHDRVCELYYQIKGGTVDYGEEHARRFGHARYGRTYESLYPNWSSTAPLHFFGHSMGGVTIWVLQDYLAKKYFSDDDCVEMIKSITTLSSPLRGTPASNILGAHETLHGEVHALSVGSILTKMIHLYEYLDLDWLRRIYDFQLDHWPFSRKKASLAQFLRSLFVRSEFSEDLDNAAHDMTVYARETFNAKTSLSPHVFYRSYATSMTEAVRDGDEEQVAEDAYHAPKLFGGALHALSVKLGQFRFSCEKLKGQLKINDDSVWWENDGVCPVYSQAHPFTCSHEKCIHEDDLRSASRPYKAGCWQVFKLPLTIHTDLVPVFLPGSSSINERRHAFWKDYLEYLRAIEQMSSTQLECCLSTSSSSSRSIATLSMPH